MDKKKTLTPLIRQDIVVETKEKKWHQAVSLNLNFDLKISRFLMLEPHFTPDL